MLPHCLNLLNDSLEGLSSWKNKLIKDYQKHDISRLQKKGAKLRRQMIISYLRVLIYKDQSD